MSSKKRVLARAAALIQRLEPYLRPGREPPDWTGRERRTDHDS
jgi:hypothetical protein